MIDCYIIHYTKLVERRGRVVEMLGRRGLNLRFIESFDKEEINGDNIGYFYSWDKERFLYKSGKIFGEGVERYRYLNLGEISCALKHLEAYRNIIEGEGEYALVVEDDVMVVGDMDLGRVVGGLPCSWDVVFLGEGCGGEYVEKRVKDFDKVGEGLYRAYHPASNCTEAYLVSKKAAKVLYGNMFPFHLPFDWELSYQYFRFNLEIYWVVPWVFSQGSKSGEYVSSIR